MLLTIEHETAYQYIGQLTHSVQYLRMTPRVNHSQRVVDWRLYAPGGLTPWTDAYGNACHTLVVDQPRQALHIVARGTVQTTDVNGVLRYDDGSLPAQIFLRATGLTAIDEVVRDFAERFRRHLEAKGEVEFLHALMHGIRDHVDYMRGSTDVHSSASSVLRDGFGVCQDHAHVFIACCRHIGIPARYVSGYLYIGSGGDPYMASHAWASALVPDLGWVSFDPSNRICGTDHYVGLAVGLDYATAAPLTGLQKGGVAEQLAVWVRVTQVRE